MATDGDAPQAGVDGVGVFLAGHGIAAVGEELLFRGALQPVLGLGLTSVLFALIHVQYGITPFLLIVLILAVILGLIRRYFSTTIAIFVHVGYDFVLGMLVLLASFLERFAV